MFSKLKRDYKNNLFDETLSLRKYEIKLKSGSCLSVDPRTLLNLFQLIIDVNSPFLDALDEYGHQVRKRSCHKGKWSIYTHWY